VELGNRFLMECVWINVQQVFMVLMISVMLFVLLNIMEMQVTSNVNHVSLNANHVLEVQIQIVFYVKMDFLKTQQMEFVLIIALILKILIKI